MIVSTRSGIWALSAGHVALTLAALFVFCRSPLQAQTPAIDDLKGKIFDARMAEQMFAGGLKHCDELDGKSFYYQIRNRILNLEEFAHSLDNLVKAQVFNPAKRRPWTLEDAKERWEQATKQAREDQDKCELVRSLPELEKRLQELQQKAAAAGTEQSGKKE
jgi:ABC-type phosphate transport system auxiliary subunit